MTGETQPGRGPAEEIVKGRVVRMMTPETRRRGYRTMHEGELFLDTLMALQAHRGIISISANVGRVNVAPEALLVCERPVLNPNRGAAKAAIGF